MKYSQDELKQMAQVALKARDSLDQRWQMLIMYLSLATNVHPHECENKIIEMAK